ncbi:MAG: TOBE domain-containing protein, partial [Nitrospinae bacterium]|nr:TOBE domain-containing protein [Nitrospinota bacterium]
FLPGRVTGQGIETKMGTFPNTPGFPEGAAVEVVIRPDQLELIPDPTSDAMVISRRFRGADTLVVVQLPSGLILHSLQPSSLLLQPRERARVMAKATHVVAFSTPMP